MSKKFFIVAKYPQTLRNPKMAHQPGLATNHAAWQNNEELKCAKNLKTRDLTEASVILDVAQQKVIKDRFDSGRGFEELFQYYMSNYADYINSWLNVQLSRS